MPNTYQYCRPVACGNNQNLICGDAVSDPVAAIASFENRVGRHVDVSSRGEIVYSDRVATCSSSSEQLWRVCDGRGHCATASHPAVAIRDLRSDQERDHVLQELRSAPLWRQPFILIQHSVSSSMRNVRAFLGW